MRGWTRWTAAKTRKCTSLMLEAEEHVGRVQAWLNGGGWVHEGQADGHLVSTPTRPRDHLLTALQYPHCLLQHSLQGTTTSMTGHAGRLVPSPHLIPRGRQYLESSVQVHHVTGDPKDGGNWKDELND